jgi:hypothetical protein
VEEEVDDSQVIMAMYPLEGPSFYSNEAELPPNIELSNFYLSHWGTTLAFCVEEELDRYISFTKNGESSNVHGEPEHDIDIEIVASSPSSTELISQVNARIDRAGLLAILQPFGRSVPRRWRYIMPCLA